MSAKIETEIEDESYTHLKDGSYTRGDGVTYVYDEEDCVAEIPQLLSTNAAQAVLDAIITARERAYDEGLNVPP